MDPTRTLASTRIVVVEDDPILLSLLRELLEAEGCEVIAHGRAADAHLLGVLAELVGPRTGLGRGGGPAGLERLTPRQREIAGLIALGYTNRQIAARLVLEEGSVANHVAHILERLGTANRAQVAAWAAMHGLVDGPRTPEDTHVA